MMSKMNIWSSLRSMVTKTSSINYTSSWRVNHIRTCTSASSEDLKNYYAKIGLREVVGFGMNGKPDYIDTITFPYPAVRFREITPDYKALKEKEKGNWRLLTTAEKKCLYRISFCNTLAEVDAPTGEWKYVVGSVLIFASLGIWVYMLITFMTRTDLPDSFKLESQKAQLRRMIDLRIDPITGISSNWDYETENWKGLPSKVKKTKDGKIIR